MEGFELTYDVQEIRLSEDHAFKVITVGDEALPLELLLDLETKREEISGQRLWEGSLLLCAHMLKSSVQRRSGFDVKGKSVLELGAGTGIVSMLAHSLGASPVVATDGDGKCVTMIRNNLAENSMSSEEVFATGLRWGEAASHEAFRNAYFDWRRQRPEVQESGVTCGKKDPDSCNGKKGESLRRLSEERRSLPAPPSSFDFILAGDVLYKHSLLAPFFKTVGDMLATGGHLLLCHIPRAGVTCDEVEKAIIGAGFGFQALDGKNGHGLAVGETITDVGGIELCEDDAGRARLFAASRMG